MNANRPSRVRSALIVVLLTVATLTGILALPRVGRAATSPVMATSARVPSQPGGDEPAGRKGHVHLVRPGETLWAIARAYHPRGDIRPFVHDLARANGGVELRIGQRLLLPGSS